MDAVYRIIGIIVCGLGGGLLCVAIVWFLGWLVCCAWAAFSNKFRAVCKVVCPANVSAEHRDVYGGCAPFYRPCEVCRREFWMQEVE